MSPKIRRRAIKGLIVIGILVALPMAVNWFMTYKLEDTLRKNLRAEVSRVTDGFYDFSFEKLDVGLFSGELMIKGLSFFPDSTNFEMRKSADRLPNTYFNIYVDIIDFKGINLTWLFNYRKLSFDKFLINEPNIKITSQHKSRVETSLSDSSARKSLYEHVSPYFDMIEAKNIDLRSAKVEYVVEDSITSRYMLEDFNFRAFNFVLDEESENKEHLLFSDNFEFYTHKPQVIFDSEHFFLNIGQIGLNTMDSIVHIGDVYLEPKEKYWEKRYSREGSCVSSKVKDVILDGIVFSRKGTDNYLKARDFSILKSNIEYYSVADKEEKKKVEVEPDSLAPKWSLYSITAPIFKGINIENINVENAKLQYSYTKKEKTDVHTLNKLDFFAQSFALDSMSHEYNFFLYVKDFSINAENIKSYIPSKNGSVDVERLYLSSVSRELRINNANITPLTTSVNDRYAKGGIKEIAITGLNYQEGIDADMVKIVSPQVDINWGVGNATEKENKDRNKGKASKKGADNILDIMAPFVSYVSIKDIRIKEGKVSFVDRKEDNRYHLDHLDFYATNFYLDKETRRLRDYLFDWDEYSFKFQDFDNITPDKKHRVQIKEGDFNSVSGNMLLKDLKVTPEPNVEGSYISIATPYASLLGLNEKAVRKRKIAFKTFILDSPVVEVVKRGDSKLSKIEKESPSNAPLELISFDLLTIPSPSFFFYDENNGSSLQLQSAQVHVDSFRWELNEKLKIDNLVVESPYISVVEEREVIGTAGNKKTTDIKSFGEIDVRRINIRKPILKIKKPYSYLDFSADSYLLKNLFWSQESQSIFQIEESDLSSPTIYYANEEKPVKTKSNKKLTKDELLKTISNYANESRLGRINISNLNLKYQHTDLNGLKSRNGLTETHFLLEDINTNWEKKKLDVGELAFSTKAINYPIMDSFYTLRVGDVDFSKRKGTLKVKKIHMDPNYPKFEFAHKHPKGKDWFNITVDSVSLFGIDASRLMNDSTLLVKKLNVDGVLLENLKNQKIEIEHNVMPLLYQEFQRLPLKYYIDDLDVKDFSVIYEELAKNSYYPARIPFTHMNGHVSDFTNIATGNHDFYTLYADGLAMGTAPFVAEWKMPIDSTNDRFYLSAEIKNMDMRDFNQLVRPMAPVYVQKGQIQKLSFNTEASSLGATVSMQFAYDSLYVVILKNMDTEKKHGLATCLINRWVIESSNNGKNMRLPNDTIVRDPYHSNFNYFWQILQPPLVKSVGITEEKQNIANNLMAIFKKVKRFFGGEKKDEKKE